MVKACLLIMFLSFGLASHAQVAFGLKGGLNLTNLDVKDVDASYESRNGYHAGIFLRGRAGKIGIQPEVLLFTQNNKIVYKSFGSYSENSFTYLAIPVMFKFYVISGLNIQVGPQFGFLIDGERTFTSPLLTTKSDIKDYYKSSDTSVSLGGGFDFPFGLNIDVRYNIGVKDINNQANGEEAKSKVFLVSLGWNFVKN